MEQPFRLRRGGRVNRHKALRFIHDGRGYSGYEGDTVASALLANGVHLIGRSLKFRRPRGIMGEGVEEPNALARLWLEPRTEPLARLTEAELAQGLRADSVRGFPSPKRDLGSMLRKLLGLAPAVIGAGFVYKTFLTMPWSSTWLWNRLWEPMLRRAAGWGISPEDPDPDAYVHRHETADLVVIGAGPAGLAAARAAVQAGAASGLRVILIERQAETGGTLLGRERTLGGSPAMTVLEGWAEDIAEAPGCRILTRTTAQVLQSTPGDGVLLLAGERLGDHHPTHSWLGPRRRLWHLRAKRVILATGSVERPLVFPDNDRPGIMTAGSVLTYLTRFGAVPGSRAVIFTCCDSAYETATALHGVGVTVEAVIDSRSEPAGPMVEMVRALSIPLFTGHVVTGTSGRKRLEQVECMPLSEDGTSVEPPFRLIDCDLLCVSGGWTPQTQLFSQAGGALGWSKTIAAPVPLQGEDAPPAADGSPRAEGLTCVGAAAGTFDLAEDLTEGHRMGRAMAEALRVSSTEKEGEGEGERDIAPQPPRSSLLLPIPLPDQNEATEITPLWCVPMPPGDALAPFRSFVDFQNDTTLADLQRAIADGLRDPEHVKRYSMAGLGSDQGRFGAVNTLGILSTLLDSPVEDLALTTQRPPYTPVPFGSFAGRFIGQALEPTRRSALDSCTHSHDSLGAIRDPVVTWMLPRCYPRAISDSTGAKAQVQTGKGTGPKTRLETPLAAIARECRAVRTGCGIHDASALGKLRLVGPGARPLLEAVLASPLDDLEEGRLRAVLRCQDSGALAGIGLLTRLGAEDYVLTTAPEDSAATLTALQTARAMSSQPPQGQSGSTPPLVHIIEETELWAVITLVGPRSAAVLGALPEPFEPALLSGAAGQCRVGSWAGRTVRILRQRLVGTEMIELHIPTDCAGDLWDALLSQEPGPTPIGQGALSVLCVEANRPRQGREIDGAANPRDLGLRTLLKPSGPWIGSAGLDRPAQSDPTRPVLVRITPEDTKAPLPREGAALLSPGQDDRAVGHLTAVHDPVLTGRLVLQGLLMGTLATPGTKLVAIGPGGRRLSVTVAKPDRAAGGRR